MATSVPDQPSSPRPVARRRRPRHLPLWFLGGFLITFVALALTLKVLYMDPSGQVVVELRLWQYYFVQIPRMFADYLGPSSSNRPVLIRSLLLHLAGSLSGGVLMLGIGWCVSKLKSPRAQLSVEETTR
jgi:hypothetical protein